MGGRGASSSLRPVNKQYEGISPSKWINTIGKKRYGYTDFVISDDNNNIILDDRINYLNARSKSYLDDYRSKIRNTEIVDIEYQYYANKQHIHMIVRKKQK